MMKDITQYHRGVYGFLVHPPPWMWPFNITQHPECGASQSNLNIRINGVLRPHPAEYPGKILTSFSSLAKQGAKQSLPQSFCAFQEKEFGNHEATFQCMPSRLSLGVQRSQPRTTQPVFYLSVLLPTSSLGTLWGHESAATCPHFNLMS